jgi:ribonuclease HI
MSGKYVHVAFDGGSSKSVGTAGYVIAVFDGLRTKEIVRKGIFLGPKHTVNDAEVMALHHAVNHLYEL